MYLDAGYAGAVCTSHFHPDRYTVSADAVQTGVKRLQALCDSQGLDFRLYAGHEIYAMGKTPVQLAAGEALSLAGSRYVLLELPWDVAPASLPGMLFQLQLEGYVPILGHCERYSYVQENISWLDEFVRAGTLVQVNLWSLLADFDREAYHTGHALLKTNRVHFLASDAHGTAGRHPHTADLIRQLRKIYGDEPMDRLTVDYPRKVIANEPIAAGPILQERKTKRWFEKGGRA